MMLSVLCEAFPVYDWNGFERVYAIVGVRFRNYVIIDRFVELPNDSDIPAKTFSVSARDLKPVATSMTSEESVLGFAHSHPPLQSIPSDEDIEGISDDLLGLVLCGDSHAWYDARGEIVVRYLR
jgi:proteasome lid subunit RPN8/RPN11